jgi:hypothetical protein
VRKYQNDNGHRCYGDDDEDSDDENDDGVGNTDDDCGYDSDDGNGNDYFKTNIFQHYSAVPQLQIGIF